MARHNDVFSECLETLLAGACVGPQCSSTLLRSDDAGEASFLIHIAVEKYCLAAAHMNEIETVLLALESQSGSSR